MGPKEAHVFAMFTFHGSSGPRDLSEWIRSEILLQIGALRPQICLFSVILDHIWCPGLVPEPDTDILGPYMVGLVVRYTDSAESC